MRHTATAQRLDQQRNELSMFPASSRVLPSNVKNLMYNNCISRSYSQLHLWTRQFCLTPTGVSQFILHPMKKQRFSSSDTDNNMNT